MSRDKKILITAAIIFPIAVFYQFCLPKNLFKGDQWSTVVTDRNGELLGARISADGQWRFPPGDSIPQKYKEALICFEDKYFRWHPGVNPFSIARAFVQNIRSGHISSGGSTITMQVIRMSRKKGRNIGEKIIEAILATRLELRCSKEEILALYAAHAPFGGNTVGLEAAAWRYFGRPAGELSWSEAATLAVLPNTPSWIHISKNREKLLAKRNRLLNKLFEKGLFSSSVHAAAIDEPLPQEPLPLPELAGHYVDGLAKRHKGERIESSIDIHLQRRVVEITDLWSRSLSKEGIADLAAIIIDIKSGEIIAYCGNSDKDRKRIGSKVDIAAAPRSTGSILKPLLYCALLQDGQILPETLLADIPVNINGFSPQNFDLSFGGAVKADEALARSLNVPAVHMLRKYGVPKFKELLTEAGMSTLTKSAGHYGLSLILGGAEGRLLEITRIYATMARSYLGLEKDYVLKDKTALWYTFEALKEVNRPDELDWRLVSSIKKVAWKTGTSYGFRDAWAVGVTPDYAVGVWAGNAQGQGMPGLTGARTAGPVLFDLFNLLPAGDWFESPDDFITAEVCLQSGHLKGIYCPEGKTVILPKAAMGSEVCPYHSTSGEFLLPPAMEWYYKQKHPEYKTVAGKDSELMEFIYPENGSIIYFPRQLDGSIQGAVFQLAHRQPSSTVYWHLDKEYVGETSYIHHLSLAPAPGKHILSCVDSSGESLSISFTVSE